jgi:hypothetical protein
MKKIAHIIRRVNFPGAVKEIFLVFLCLSVGILSMHLVYTFFMFLVKAPG